MARINFSFILTVVGRMCLVQVVMMLLCLAVSALYGETLYPFALGAVACLSVGGLLIRLGRLSPERRVARREGMLTVTLTWLVLSLLAVIPLLMSGATSNFDAALFETVSGFTTTGATVFDAIEHLPKGILFLRSLMQWQGGIGIVVFTVALVPLFGGGASQIFNAETTGITHDRFLPRITDVAKRLILIYLLETGVLLVLLLMGPMNTFDAVCHTLSCISTGGYSTHDVGIRYYDSPYVEYVLTLFMYIGSLNIALVYFLALGKPMKLIRDEEFRWFSYFLLACTVITTTWLWYIDSFDSLEETIRRAAFHVVSLGSSTGFITEDITQWRPFFWMLAIMLMFINGCAGSTSGGLKMSRFMVLVKNLRNEFKKQLQPHLITPVVVNGKQVNISLVHQVLAFCVLYVILIFLGALLILLDGNGFAESITIATSCISNSGPGIATYASSVSSAGDFTKLVLSFLMLAGRLEVFTVMGILTPYFWRN